MVTPLSIDASPWEQEVHDHFVAHIATEERMLAEYQALSESSDSRAIRYLIRLILEDEARHHRLFEELENALQTGVELRGPEPRVPAVDRDSHPDQLLALSERFLAVEERDARDLKKLRRKLRPLHRESLWPLLVELMELDTKKHIRALRFIRDRLQRQH